jgi:5-methylcytosine-specific restriction endonuclease McrA
MSVFNEALLSARRKLRWNATGQFASESDYVAFLEGRIAERPPAPSLTADEQKALDAARREEIAELFIEQQETEAWDPTRGSIARFGSGEDETPLPKQQSDERRLCRGCGRYLSIEAFTNSRSHRCVPCSSRAVGRFFAEYRPGDLALRLRQLQRCSPLGEGLISDFTPEGWERTVLCFRGMCAYCGSTPDDPHQDHILAIAAGGHDLLSNIAPCCPSCNSSKGAKRLEVWLRRCGKEFALDAYGRLERAGHLLGYRWHELRQ